MTTARRRESDGDRPRRSTTQRLRAVAQSDAVERLTALEATIADGSSPFYEVGRALLVINEERLYRLFQYATFAEYVGRRWGISRGQAYRKMGAARVVGILREAGVERLPANEGQARELAPLVNDPRALLEAWLAATASVDADGLSAAAIRTEVKHLRALTAPRRAAGANLESPAVAAGGTLMYRCPACGHAWVERAE